MSVNAGKCMVHNTIADYKKTPCLHIANTESLFLVCH